MKLSLLDLIVLCMRFSEAHERRKTEQLFMVAPYPLCSDKILLAKCIVLQQNKKMNKDIDKVQKYDQGISIAKVGLQYDK